MLAGDRGLTIGLNRVGKGQEQIINISNTAEFLCLTYIYNIFCIFQYLAAPCWDGGPVSERPARAICRRCFRSVSRVAKRPKVTPFYSKKLNKIGCGRTDLRSYNRTKKLES